MPNGVFKYYQVIVRKKGVVTPEMLEGMKLAIWEFLNDISKKDIIARKISKPHNLRWREGG